MSRNRVKGFIPWVILTMVLCYGQYQTYRISSLLKEDGKWFDLFVDASIANMRHQWTHEQQVDFAKANSLLMPRDSGPVTFALPMPPR